MAKSLDPYACGPQCCTDDPCDKDPLEILITNGMPQGKPDPCDHLPIAYDAATGCFYLWQENSGWFEASGVRIQHNDTDTTGTGDNWDIEVCDQAIKIYNSRNTELELEVAGNDVAGFPQHLVLRQTNGPSLTVDLSPLDSWVTALSIVQDGDDYSLRLTQSAGRPTLTVPLPDWLTSVATDDSINGDGTADDPLSVNWDDLCEEAESLSSMPDDAQIIICASTGVKKVTPDSLLADLCYNDVPDLGLTCGNTSRLILVTDADGCDRLARIDSVGVTLASGRYWNVRGAKPENTSGYVLPDDFPTPNLYYSVADYLADGGTDPNDRSGINDAIITNSRVAAASFAVPCTKLYNFLVSALFVREATAEEAYSRYATLSFRWRVDGGQWFYATTPGTGQVTQFAARFAIEGRIDVDTTITLPEGNVDMELFYLSSDYNAGDPGNARLQANTNAPSFGSGSPSFRLQQIV